eukprot:TRINITY_DN731_c0_g1_i1.p1 TRINITY_DN731_c0_g1~~TRINITY_DN731_c0_g1_i1.p1  ORF type:complete len:292 (+),score=68.43 TRINITY_DN731_c0_g1_i1:127-876(+)
MPPKAKKTGTTIAGVVFKDGVVLGADTRASSGELVVEKNCKKIHYMAPNMYCCGAGTAADTENTTALIASNLELHRLATGRESRVITAVTMLKDLLFRYQGHIGAYLVLGGVDCTGPHLWSIHAAGSIDSVPFVTLGSGSLAAMTMFEAHYRPNMELEEAKRLVHSAICGGIFNDLGSGSNVDLCVITKGHVDYLRNMDIASTRTFRRAQPYSYPPGTTAVLSSKFLPLESQGIDVAEVQEGEPVAVSI